MLTILIGLGNPLLGDDGFGWRVVEAISGQLSAMSGQPLEADKPQLEIFHQKCDIDFLSVGGLSLMEHLVGYDYAILVDAIITEKLPQGTLSSFPLEALPEQAAGHMNSAHDTTLQTALRVGRSLGAHLPQKVDIVSVETINVYDFSDELSAPVAAAIPEAIRQVIQLLQGIP